MIEDYTKKIIFVDDQLLDNIKHSSLKEYEDLMSPSIDTQIISLPLVSSNIVILSDLMDVSDIETGRVLVKENYGKKFFPISNMSKEYVVKKYRILGELCVALGAKKITIKSAEEVLLDQDVDNSTSMNVNVSSRLFDLDSGLNIKSSDLTNDALKEVLAIKIESEGSLPNIGVAERLLKSYSLHNDDMFVSLVELRKITTNKLLSHEFNLDFSKDVKKTFSSSTDAKLKVLNKFVGGGVEWDAINRYSERNRSAIKLVIKVEF